MSMLENPLVYTIFLIFTGAAILATVALYTRQSLLVAYILLGFGFGPWGLKLVSNLSIAHQIGEVGIIFLLFLLGLDLHPQNLVHMLRKVSWIALISSLVFAVMSYIVCRLFGYNSFESMLVGAAMMFSSTIIGLKLLPTNTLHHQHTGQVVIGVLLMQDMIAIVMLILLNGPHGGNLSVYDILITVVAFPILVSCAFLAEKYILAKLLMRFDKVQEYIFLLAIGWCLAWSELAQHIGLSEDIGAFVAGVAIAASPISLFIAESLKPLRDFFLVLFFFSVGASFDFQFIGVVAIPALILAMLIMLVKPLLFKLLLKWTGESNAVAQEVGVRLGQASEFSLLVANVALLSALSSNQTAYLIQATTILTFIASSYLVVLRYPTPVAFNDKMPIN